MLQEIIGFAVCRNDVTFLDAKIGTMYVDIATLSINGCHNGRLSEIMADCISIKNVVRRRNCSKIGKKFIVDNMYGMGFVLTYTK